MNDFLLMFFDFLGYIFALVLAGGFTWFVYCLAAYFVSDKRLNESKARLYDALTDYVVRMTSAPNKEVTGDE